MSIWSINEIKNNVKKKILRLRSTHNTFTTQHTHIHLHNTFHLSKMIAITIMPEHTFYPRSQMRMQPLMRKLKINQYIMSRYVDILNSCLNQDGKDIKYEIEYDGNTGIKITRIGCVGYIKLEKQKKRIMDRSSICDSSDHHSKYVVKMMIRNGYNADFVFDTPEKAGMYISGNITWICE